MLPAIDSFPRFILFF